MPMTLYSSPTSPFVRKVTVLVAEARLAGQVEVKAVAGNPLAPGSLPVDLNPLGKIPALVLDSGLVLYDSRVICRFLDDLAGGGFYPKGADLWPVLALEALADGIMEAGVSMTYEVRVRPEAARLPEWIEGQWAKIARALDVLEAQKMPLLAGPLTMAQIAVGVALSYLDFRHDARGWRVGHPALAAWEAGFALRPSMVASVPVQS